MNNESAVQFETKSRIHMGLAAKDLERSVAFYRTLFGQEPTKTRPRYAKFEVAEPPINLSLNEVGGETGPGNPVAHFGIQVKSTEAVRDMADRLAAAGVATDDEKNVTCCYAVQNKVWTADPDGNKWEVYVVLDDEGAHHQSSSGECCPAVPDIPVQGIWGMFRRRCTNTSTLQRLQRDRDTQHFDSTDGRPCRNSEGNRSTTR